MKYLLLLFFVSLSAIHVSAGNTSDSLLRNLTATIQKASEYDQKKTAVIQQLQLQLQQADPRNLEASFGLTEKIYEEYKVFKYDSAYVYATKLLHIARQSGNPGYIATAQMKTIFVLLSTGLYKETYDSLRTTTISNGTALQKADYYALWARYYYDIAGYANDNYHSVNYDIDGAVYLDSALMLYPRQSFEYAYYSGLRAFKQGKKSDAFAYFEPLLSRPGLSDHEYALTASTLSGIYQERGNISKAIELLAKATEADIRSSTKETVAIFHLAELLYKTGSIKEAVLYIETATANAEFYGARQRKLQASSILPLIEGERINAIEAQKHLLIQYAIVVSVLVLLLGFLIYTVVKQVKKLKHAQELLTQAHHRQQLANQQLEETNHRLEEANEKLEEANKIKEEYIGYFFNTDSQLYARLEKIKITLLQKITERKYDEAKFFVDKIDPKREKDELLQNFDKLFLKLFPHFTDEINKILHPEDALKLKDQDLLTTDLRIFALIRMGISDTEKIAQILGYSVKTIYAYKTKMKNKSIVPNDEFEDRIMKIKTL